jgi:hypothetical protein
MAKATTQFYWEDKSRWWAVEALDSVASKRVKAFIGGVDGLRQFSDVFISPSLNILFADYNSVFVIIVIVMFVI